MLNPSSVDLLGAPLRKTVATDISERLSKELVIALVGPVGSGVSTTAGYIREVLTQTFSYDVYPIVKLSGIIKAEAYRVGIALPPDTPLDAYITQMQTAGNKLREQFGGHYLAEKAVEKIYKFRHENGGYEGEIPLPGRRAYIIDSLKNVEELDILRQIYGETLCIFGVFAPDAMRKTRLVDAGTSETHVKQIIDRDQNEIPTFGQKTRKLFVQADFFICNDLKKDELRNRVVRYLELLFDTAVHTPTRAESAMYEASSASANSACMSRQVGAAIVSERGEMIAVGWNDVPRYGGGLYTENDQFSIDASRNTVVDRDNRCFKWGGCICHNETRRTSIVDSVVKRIADAGLIKSGKTQSDLKVALSGSEIEVLIEYSRSIHAEMEAILLVAREGRYSLVGSTLYTNTYPCHNCARHIVASGITQVVYIEPYLKSLAIALHHDAITEDPQEQGKVIFRQYDGVAPGSYLRLFRPKAERKLSGRLSRPHPASAVPIFRVQLDSQANYEEKVIADLSNKEQTM